MLIEGYASMRVKNPLFTSFCFSKTRLTKIWYLGLYQNGSWVRTHFCVICTKLLSVYRHKQGRKSFKQTKSTNSVDAVNHLLNLWNHHRVHGPTGCTFIENMCRGSTLHAFMMF